MSTASGRKTRGGALIAAERRRRIYDLALRRGAVSVSELAAALRVAENTIRNDLDALEREGKLQRSHGGAVLKDQGRPAPPYQEMRVSHLVEKSWIGQAAARFLPDTGSVFINSGSTACQLALNIREGMGFQVTTNSPEIAVLIASNTSVPVDLLGGRILRDSLETDGSLSEDPLESLYWDVVFYGMTAIDAEHGITSTSLQAAKLDRRILSHGRRVVGLCDSSKFGLYASAKVGPLTLLDVLVTDSKARPEHIHMLQDAGIEVVVADGPPQVSEEG
ncbi:MAG: DeoR family transcriptional regulator [Armatimonadota bacterium]|nr:MAG: DeoR family transcriptional regulator [Armatimonadota bacterium]